MAILHAYTNSVADATVAGLVHPADWLAAHIIGAGTALNGLAPVGAVAPYAGLVANIPAGWIFCNGASLLRAGTYADLYAAIGTVYGAADADHFNLPDCRDKFIVGANQDSGGLPKSSITGALAQSYAPTTANLTHSLTIANHTMAAHSGFSVADHTMTHTVVAIANHPTLQLTGTIADHPTLAMATITKSTSRTTAITSPVNSVTWPICPTKGHTFTQIADHTATHGITQPTSHAGDLTHSFTPPANHTFATPVPAFVALAYCVRYA